ncbi:MAG: methylated-DNA--[protein]-cysteine S-methyltransferase [Planctomycetota bacterium]
MEATLTGLPPRAELMRAFLDRDPAWEGLFWAGVSTTGIFCRPTCAARKPRPEHVEFFATARDALFSGYRPCKRCRPLERAGTAPDWLAPLLEHVEAEPGRRFREQDLRALGLHPDRVRRWFKREHGMTFHAYCRACRLGGALARIRAGSDALAAGLDAGFESSSGFAEAVQRLCGEPPARAGRTPQLLLARLRTPLGPMLAGATDEGLVLCEFADRRMLERQLRALGRRLGCRAVPGRNAALDLLRAELEDYLAGTLRDFTVPLAPCGTAFQLRVWNALRAIPYGTTTSYAAVAEAIGRPSAVRAVARANGDNRLAVLIPCHRVIGSDGRLTGYGGGLWRKRRLLELEGAPVPAG